MTNVCALPVCVCVWERETNSSTIPSVWHDDSGCLPVIGLVGGTALHIFPAVLRTYWHSMHIHHYNYQPTHTCTACLNVYHLIFHKQHPSGYYRKSYVKILLKIRDYSTGQKNMSLNWVWENILFLILMLYNKQSIHLPECISVSKKRLMHKYYSS